jgi:osmotically-inducible protein OsmY
VSTGTACETVARLTECEEFAPTADSLQAMQNLALASRVRAKLAADSRTRDVDLEVLADGGIVTITGHTNAPAADKAIEAVARTVDGVMEVRSKVVFFPVYPGT